MSPPARVGQRLSDKYELVQLLGQGGMGEVYLARNTRVGRNVAIKTLRPEHAGNEVVVARFLREAKAANLVSHPHVVQVLDVDLDEHGVPFIVQELLEGESLAEHLERAPDGLPVDAALGLLTPVAQAVGAAHEQGVVHRDLKPDNVFLARHRGVVVPKILDFGISKVLGPELDIRLTSTNTIMGSPGYMSPEQITRPRDVGVAADVWALGVTLFETLTGCLPFEAESAEGLFVAICTQEPRGLLALAPEAPPMLAEVVARCLAREPAERYADGNQVAWALGKITESLGPGDTIVETEPAGGRQRRITGVTERSLTARPPPPGRRAVEHAETLEAKRPGVFTVPEELQALVEAPLEPVSPPARAPIASETARDRRVRKERARGSGAAGHAPDSQEAGSVTNLLSAALLVGGIVWVTPLFGAGALGDLASGLGDLAVIPFVGVAVVLLATGLLLLPLAIRQRAGTLGFTAAGLVTLAGCVMVTGLHAVWPDGVGPGRQIAAQIAPLAGATVAVGLALYGLLRARLAFVGRPRRAGFGLLLVLAAIGGIAAGGFVLATSDLGVQTLRDLTEPPPVVGGDG